MGNSMLKHHFFHHVLFEHEFKDDHLFYRFLEDEDISPMTLNASSGVNIQILFGIYPLISYLSFLT